MTEFPKDLCDFVNYTIPDEKWWDGHELTRVDLSMNKIEYLPPEIASQGTIATFSMNSNLLTSVPDDLFLMENLRVLDLSNNKLSELPQALG